MNPQRRIGGDLVIESLAALGATTVFGLPGQHALGVFNALGRSKMRYIGSRTEPCATFSADGYARITGQPGIVLASTGPGALLTLASLQESNASSTPIVLVLSQVPRAGLRGRRRGYLHELRDQTASVREVVKSTYAVGAASQIPSAVRAAWETALTSPRGPAWVEIPVDVLLTEIDHPPPGELTVDPRPLVPQSELIIEAARRLDAARRPAILAGGGVSQAHAEDVLLRLAERLRAPVATTFGGKGVFPWRHPLSLQSWLEDSHITEFLGDADVLLIVGSGLGELSSNYHTFRPRGALIQIEADLEKLEANHAALGIHADAHLALSALADAVSPRRCDGVSERRVADVLDQVKERLDSQGLQLERDLLDAIRSALPSPCASFWDMTILAYWAWSAWDPVLPRTMHSAQGAGGLGYALPAALGAAAASGDRVLAVSGDGGAMYGIAELATARQHNIPVTWLIVNDGGYGILREYMTSAFGSSFGTKLAAPEFSRLAAAFGIPATSSTPSSLERDLVSALEQSGPNVVVLSASPKMFAPTHANG